MRSASLLSCLLLCVLLTPLSAQAQSAKQHNDTAYLSLGIGVYDALRASGAYSSRDFAAADFRIEYRSADIGLPLNLKPWAGFEITSDASKWGGFGLLYDWRVDNNIIITPNAGVGLYDDGASELDLQGAVEFRLQLEAAYELRNKHRIGLALGHISNAGTGDDNPGTETINIYYHIPIGGLF